MKPLLFGLLVLALAFPLRADNWIDNGNFTEGIDHWRGNGRAPSDFAPENPMDKPDPLTSKGLILQLREADWDKVQQDFHGKSTDGVLTITYMMSPDLTFSKQPDDYSDVPDQIHYDDWDPFSVPAGNWVVFIADFGKYVGNYYVIQPKRGAKGVQTYKAKVQGLTPLADKTITLAVPPGKGTMVILSVSLTDSPDK